MHHSYRVLSRTGARELTLEETHRVGAAIAVHTDVCTIPLPPLTRTGIGGDGDACGAGDIDNG